MAMDWNTVVSVSSDEDDVEDRRSQGHHVRVFREQNMFHQEIVRWNDHDQIFVNLVECDVRIRRRPFQWEGHRRFERRIVFLPRARVKSTDIERSGWMF